MLEFLAPWGVIAPAASAIYVYMSVVEERRRRMLEEFKAPGAR